jgi:SNF2 family DNA or RNA helicase
MTSISTEGASLLVRTEYHEINLVKCRGIPDRKWNKAKKAWVCRASMVNFDYLKEAWPDAKWTDEAIDLLRAAKARAEKREAIRTGKGSVDFSPLAGVPFKHEPYDHQKKALVLARDMPVFAYLLDQGTGKTKVTIDDAAHQFRQDKIDALLIIAPNSVKTNWVNLEDPERDEIANHMPPDVPVLKAAWHSSPNKAQKRGFDKWFNAVTNDVRSLKVFAVNVEALAVERCYEFLLNFVNSFRTMIVVDESTRIKSRSAKRTKNAKKLRKLCAIARILSGTPIIQSPLDAYSQFDFLDNDILGFGSFYAFQNHYAQLGGFQNRQVLFFKNLDELSDKIASCSFRVTKQECLDLPAKVYQRRTVEMTKEQDKAYAQMREEMFVQWKDKPVIDAPLALTQLLRLQQITGGYLPELDPVTGETIDTIELVHPDHNPKIQEALDIIDESGDQKIIIWARFKDEIQAMAYALGQRKISYVRFDGDVKEADRAKARIAFQEDPRVKVFLGNPAAGGIGLNLYAATIVLYLSNSFSTEQRVQSEDRAHRIGTVNPVTYYDIVVPATVDVKVLSALRGNKRIADEVMRDGICDWI